MFCESCCLWVTNLVLLDTNRGLLKWHSVYIYHVKYVKFVYIKYKQQTTRAGIHVCFLTQYIIIPAFQAYHGASTGTDCLFDNWTLAWMT